MLRQKKIKSYLYHKYSMPPYRRRGRKPRAKKPVSLSPAMKTAIKRVVAPAEEVKYAVTQWTSQQAVATLSTAAAANLYQMLPSVASGVGANQRLGNSLNPKSIRTHFAMYFNNDSVNTANLYVRLLCVSSREIKTYTNLAALSGNNLFLNSSGGAQDISGNYSDNLRANQFLPVNKKAWIVHHDKTFHMAKGYGFTNNDNTSPRTPTGYVPLCHSITMTTPHKGALKYDSAADSVANNFAPLWCAYAWTADNGTASIYPIQIDTRSEILFTD